MPMQSQVLTGPTSSTINSSGNTTELQLANQCFDNIVIAYVTSPSSLVGGFILGEIQDTAGNWIGAPQEVCLVASGGGTPAVVNANTASATAVVGGSARNTTGITALTNTATLIFKMFTGGRPLRMRDGASSGSATVSYEHTGTLEI